jgi:hypothetical protein
MSKYLTENELFIEPKTTQYGSHMVMTNVSKPTKTKYINIDTRFRDEYNNDAAVNYNITLPERITDVKSMCITNVEIPMSIYNISAALGNNCFKIKNTTTNISTVITIDDKQYTTVLDVLDNINSKLISDLLISYSSDDNRIDIENNSSTNGYSIDFATAENGTPDKYYLRSKLGWLLGYRQPTYTLSSSTTNVIVAEQLCDLTGPRYLYLAIDEFTRGNQHSFISPLPTSLINKSIIARINIDRKTHEFGSLFLANRMIGYLLSDERSYTGKVDIQKLNIQLLNEYGVPVNLNGLDFSFCMEVKHE